ncbi:MAG TPA: L,D-transpeptidase [Pseudonocardia sp.]|nr:L,D-transpeptidase [Pseudonocardia sp.]
MFNRVLLATLIVAVWGTSTVTGSVLQSRQNLVESTQAARTTADESALSQGGTPLPPPILPGPILPGPPGPPPRTPGANPLLVAPQAPLPPPPPPPPATVKGVPCLSNVSACVRLSTRQAWLLDNGRVLAGPVPITSGKAGERTPTGTHRVLWKDKDHLSREFDDAPMPYSVFFAAGGIAFHSGSLRAQSSGCIHLSDATAKRFFSNLAVGDVVQVLK